MSTYFFYRVYITKQVLLDVIVCVRLHSIKQYYDKGAV